MRHLRAALHQALDLVLDAIEKDKAGPVFVEQPTPKKVEPRRRQVRQLPPINHATDLEMDRRMAHLLTQKRAI